MQQPLFSEGDSSSLPLVHLSSKKQLQYSNSKDKENAQGIENGGNTYLKKSASQQEIGEQSSQQESKQHKKNNKKSISKDPRIHHTIKAYFPGLQQAKEKRKSIFPAP